MIFKIFFFAFHASWRAFINGKSFDFCLLTSKSDVGLKLKLVKSWFSRLTLTAIIKTTCRQKLKNIFRKFQWDHACGFDKFYILKENLKNGRVKNWKAIS